MLWSRRGAALSPGVSRSPGGQDQGWSRWRAGLGLRTNWAGAFGTSKPGRRASTPERNARVGSELGRPPLTPILPARRNYIEGTKMLAAYLYEVSQLKD